MLKPAVKVSEWSSGVKHLNTSALQDVPTDWLNTITSSDQMPQCLDLPDYPVFSGLVELVALVDSSTKKRQLWFQIPTAFWDILGLSKGLKMVSPIYNSFQQTLTQTKKTKYYIVRCAGHPGMRPSVTSNAELHYNISYRNQISSDYY